MKKAIIFDMDGVIFDSERAAFAVWSEIAKKNGFRDFETPYRKCIGVNAEACRRILTDFYGEAFSYDDYRAEWQNIYRREYSGGRLPMKSGVKELLSYLKQNGYAAAIASSTATKLVRAELQEAGLLSFFDFIVGGDQVTHSKPDPEIFLKAASLLPKETEKIYVIEDSYNGIRAAHSAGLKAIMVPDMLPPTDEMREKAFAVLPSLSAVLEMLVREDQGG